MVSGTSSLYDLIYQVGIKGPGYERYLRYQEGVISSPDPLGFLAEREDVYWMVREAISQAERNLGSRKESIRVLEIGSGFGYLTYSLRKMGYLATGIDISSTAVDRANQQFGPLYENRDLMSLPDSFFGTFHIIIATELIEHLDSPVSFLNRALRLLAPGGCLILTTPARELYPLDRAWHTDPPPVHLWWFSRTSLRQMAWRLGAYAHFINPTPYYSDVQVPKSKATKSSFFDSNGNVVFSDSLMNGMARWLMRKAPILTGLIARTFIARMRKQRYGQSLYDTSLSHCVVLTPAVSMSEKL